MRPQDPRGRVEDLVQRGRSVHVVLVSESEYCQRPPLDIEFTGKIALTSAAPPSRSHHPLSKALSPTLPHSRVDPQEAGVQVARH